METRKIAVLNISDSNYCTVIIDLYGSLSLHFVIKSLLIKLCAFRECRMFLQRSHKRNFRLQSDEVKCFRSA